MASGLACQMGRAGSESGRGQREQTRVLISRVQVSPHHGQTTAQYSALVIHVVCIAHPCSCSWPCPLRGPFDRPPRVTPDKVAAAKKESSRSSRRPSRHRNDCSRRQRACLLCFCACVRARDGPGEVSGGGGGGGSCLLLCASGGRVAGRVAVSIYGSDG